RITAAMKELEQTRARIASRADAEQAAAARQLDEARQAATQRFDTESVATRKAYVAARDDSECRRDEAHDRAIHQYEESRWTTVTVCEASEKAAKGPLEKVQHET